MASWSKLLFDTVQRVEVSGWDSDENFFVEKSSLNWDDFTGRHVSLCHMLEDGAMIFVRSMEQFAECKSSPVPYETQFSGCDEAGRFQFRLNTPMLSQCGASEYLN